MEQLTGVDALVVRQKKEWGEILTSFETRNKYVITDTDGTELLYAAESSGFLSRNFLRSSRPWTIEILDLQGQPVLHLRRPFKFIYHRVEVSDAGGQMLGTVERRWPTLRRVFTVRDAAGNKLYELFGPILHPWTFRIHQSGQEVGRITKKWSGLMKEVFTKADNFGIALPPQADPTARAVLLGAVFLIDFMYFEGSSSGD